MKNKKIIFSIIGLVALAGGVIAGVFLVGQRQLFQQKAAPATTLSLSPSNQSFSPGEQATFRVYMDTGTNEVTGIDIELIFNPLAIEFTGIQNGSDISSLDQTISSKNEIDNANGSITFTAFTLDTSSAVSGSNLEVLIITGKVKDSAVFDTYSISFDPSTNIAGVGEGQNILSGSSSLNFSVIASGATATSTSKSSTPTSTAISTSTSSSVSKTSTPTATAIATSFPIPETGVAWPAFGIGMLGLIALSLSIFLAL